MYTEQKYSAKQETQIAMKTLDKNTKKKKFLQ